MAKTYNDPENYAKLCAPMSDEKAFRDALDSFYELVKQARQTCGIPDVEFVVMGYVNTPATEEQPAKVLSMITGFHFGDPQHSEMMSGWAYGLAKREREALLAEVLSGKAN